MMQKTSRPFLALLFSLFFLLPVGGGASERDTPAVAITVLGFGSPYSQDFTRQTGIAVTEIQPRGGDSMDKLATAMVTREGSVDIYAFYAKDGLLSLKEKGYFVDLRTSPVLSAALHELYPALGTAIQHAGQIAVWPAAASVSFRGMDEYMMADNQLQSPATWEEALDLIAELEARGVFAEGVAAPFAQWNYCRGDMLKYFVQEYLLARTASGAPITFDTPDFRRVAGRIMRQVPLHDPYPRSEGWEDTLFSVVGSNVDWGQFELPLKISREDPGYLPMNARILVVNPYSKHREAAIQYLEFLATKRTREDYGMYQSLTAPIIDEEFNRRWEEAAAALEQLEQKLVPQGEQLHHQQRLQQLREEVRMLAISRYQVSQESIDSYQAFAPHFVVLEDPLILYNEKLGQLVDRLVAGGLDLEGFIREADQYIRLVMQERGMETGGKTP